MESGRLEYLDIRRYTIKSWPEWIAKFRKCMETELPRLPNRQKVSLLLTKMGKDSYEIFRSLNVRENVDFDELVHCFDVYFQPLYARWVFLSRKQRDDESFDAFANTLTILSSPCLYGMMQGLMVRDIFVTNMNDKYDHLRQKLVKEKDPTLTEALVFVKSFIGTQRISETLQSSSISSASEYKDLAGNLEGLSLSSRSLPPSENGSEMLKTTGVGSRLNKFKIENRNARQDDAVSCVSTSSTWSRALDFSDDALSLPSVCTTDTAASFKSLGPRVPGTRLNDVTDGYQRMSSESVRSIQPNRFDNGRPPSIHDARLGDSQGRSHGQMKTADTASWVRDSSVPSIPRPRGGNSRGSGETSSLASVMSHQARGGGSMSQLSKIYSDPYRENIFKNVKYPADKGQKTKSAEQLPDDSKTDITPTQDSGPVRRRDPPVAVRPLENPPLPVNKYSEVIVVYIDQNTNIVHVSPTEKGELFQGISGELQSLVEDNLLDSVSTLVVNGIYAAPWQGAWYRAELVSLPPVEQSMARVRFIDYGNFDDVECKYLKILPTHLRSQVLEPLSFPVMMPNRAPKFASASRVRIKLLSQNENKEWRVDIDGADCRT